MENVLMLSVLEAHCCRQAPLGKRRYKAIADAYTIVSRYLLEQGYRNRKGANFADTTIVKMLKNIMYTGVLRSGETQSEVFPHLQIVEPELFARAQDIMEGRTQKHSDVPLNSKGQALLSGLVYCAHCGSKLVLTTSGDSRNRANPQ